MKKALALAAMLALAACAAPIDQRAQNICLNNGHTFGTPAFHDCFNRTFAALTHATGMALGGRPY